MKFTLLFALVALVIGCSGPKAPSNGNHSKHDAAGPARHGDAQNQVLVVESNPAVAAAGVPVALKLMIHGVDGTMVREFDIAHEKLLHLIMVREGLDEFAHVHPTVDDKGSFTISHTFPKAGTYRIYADYKPKGKAAAVATTQIDVKGEKSSAPPLVANVPGVVTADGLAAKIELSNAKGGKEAEVRFVLNDESGQPIEKLERYLGARGHLVIVGADGNQYVHAHPMDESSSANEVVFMAHFPRSGTYKGWGQFSLSGRVRTVPFVVQVR